MPEYCQIPTLYISPKASLEGGDARNLLAMTTDVKEKPRRVKRYISRVRTGCQTCKIRRVKCDEERPFCQRCTTTGRTCDGYELPIKQHQQIVAAKSLSLTRSGASLTKISGTSEESRSLEFYFQRAAPKISGLLGNDFWFRHAFQIGYSEQAVRHALIAIGYLFETQGKAHASQYCRFPVYTEDEFLLGQYNRAIGCLIKRISDTSDPSEVSVVTCVLLMCLECMMRRPLACYVHYRSGLDILLSMRKQKTIGRLPAAQDLGSVELKSSASNPTIAPKRPTTDLVEETLVPLFTRLTVSAILNGAERSTVPISFTESTTLRNIPTTFPSADEAWYILVDLMNQGLKFITMSAEKKYTQTLLAEDFSLQSRLLLCLDHWLRALTKYECTSGKSHKTDPLLCSLWVLHRCTWIWLSCCTDPLEMEYDNHLDGFQQLVSMEEVLVNNWSATNMTATTELNFTHDMEFVAPTYFTTFRCRDPIVRRKALSLLQKCKRREGLWDSEQCVAMAKRILAFEEAGLSGPLDHRYPPTKSRIHDAVCGVDQGPSFRATFFTLPDGLGSIRYSWHEILYI